MFCYYESMNHMKHIDSQTHDYYDGAVRVTEFKFSDSDIINDAEIIITGRYPIAGYAVNDISTALVSVESGTGTIIIKDSKPQEVKVGDRILIASGEPYSIKTRSALAIRYIATPAWTAGQSRLIEELV